MKHNPIFSAKLAIPALCSALLIISVAGCSAIGNVIVDVDIDVQIRSRDAEGRTWKALPEEIIKNRGRQAASPFANVRYLGKIFEWSFSGNPVSIGSFARSNVSGPVCFRFDEARLMSNFHVKEIPLRVRSSRTGSQPGPITMKKSKPGEDRYFVMATFCAATDKGSTVSFVPDVSVLFPSGQLYNINQTGKDLNYSQRGAGNWLKLFVPIEYEGRREELEIVITGIDSKARMSYH